MLLVLKALLTANQLNSAYKGGLNSYSALIWTVAWLKSRPHEDYGELLLSLLDFYGNQFDPTTCGIRLHQAPIYFPKQDEVTTTLDPVRPSNNTTRSAHQIQQVLQLFARTHSRLLRGSKEVLKKVLSC